MILKLTCGRFELRKSGDLTEYWIDREQVDFSELEPTDPARITLEVLQELMYRENEDSGLSWES